MIKLECLEVFKVAEEIGNLVWEIVSKWKIFEKDTLGKQFTRAADSISFNIAEGYGRYFYKENRVFCYYSRGSAKETLAAIRKARKRKLITDKENSLLIEKLNFYFILMAGYIKSIGTNPSTQ